MSALPWPRPALHLTPLQTWWATQKERLRLAKAVERGQRGLLDLIAPDWVEHTPDAFIIGKDGHQVWTRTLVVKDWPARVKAGWLAPALFGCGGDVSIALHTDRLSDQQAKRLVHTQRLVQATITMARAERGAIRDPATTLNTQSVDAVAEALEDAAECLFSTTLAITLRAPNAEALGVLEQAVRSKLGGAFGGMHWHQAAGLATTGLQADNRLGRHRTIDTTTLAFSVPFLSQRLGTTQGPFLGRALADHRPVLLDLWATDEPPEVKTRWTAPHLVIGGPTGNGKSTAALTLASGYATEEAPPDILLVDPMKGDYRSFVKALGGTIIRMSSRPEYVINGFDLPPVWTFSGTGDRIKQNPILAQTRLVIGLLVMMLSDETTRITKRERSLLESAVLAAYGSYGLSVDDESTWTPAADRVPILPDVVVALRSLGANTLAEGLQPYCTGTLSGLFGKHTNIVLGQGITSFDLEGLDEELRPLAVWLIGNLVWRLAATDRRRRIICLDEVKTLLEYPESARLVAHLYALGRARNLSVWSMSQLLSDYTSTQEGERALQNANTVLLLKQAPGKGVEEAMERFALSEEDGAFLTTCTRGQGLLCTPTALGRVEVLPPPYLLELLQPCADQPTSLSPDSVRPSSPK